MKIILSSGDKFCRRHQIEINKYKTVKQIKCLVPDLWKANIGNDFQFIYKNIILNDEKMITFYNLKENDEIKIGKLEQFLNNDDVIVELFIAGWNAAFIHLIVNKNDRISTIRSIIVRIIENIVNIWNANGIEMRNNQFVNEIDLIGGYYKLVISDKFHYNDNDLIGRYSLIVSDKFGDVANEKSVNEIDDIVGRYDLIVSEMPDNNAKRKFSDCCKIHDQYLWWYHAWQFIMCLETFLSIFDHSQKQKMIERIRRLQSFLSMNDVIAPRLNEDLSNLPTSFVNSRFIFCNCMMNRIIDICAEYKRTMIDQHFTGLDEMVGELFTVCLYSVLLGYSTNRQSTGHRISTTLRSIVNDSWQTFIRILNNQCSLRLCVLDYFRAFALQDYSKCNSDKIMKDKLLNKPCFFSLKINKHSVQLYLSQKSINTNIQLKKSISMQTNIPIQQLYLIKDFGAEPLTDHVKLDALWLYSIEIMSDIKNIEELKLLGHGASGTVHLCQDRVTHKQFVLKKPVKQSGNLCRDIGIQYRFPHSSKLSRYSALFYNKGETFFAMDYYAGGSLSSYMKKVGQLPENEVVKISAQLLIQIYELHKHGMIHRDIKSDNVVLNEYMEAKLIDFGSSKFTLFPGGDLLEKRQLYTPGTPFYMAPELINSKPYTSKIDIWSFGMMVVEMVTGNRPFYGFTPFQAVIKLHNCCKIEYKCSQPISEELKLFIDSCLNTDPNKRPSARQLLMSELFKKYFSDTNNSQSFSLSFPDFYQLFSEIVKEPMGNQQFEKFKQLYSIFISESMNDHSSQFQQKLSNFFMHFETFPHSQQLNIECEPNERNMRTGNDNHSQFDIQNSLSNIFSEFLGLFNK